MRKCLILLVFILFSANLFAQEKDKIRAGFNAGYSMIENGSGFTGDIDVRYNLFSNFNAGVRFGISSIAKRMYYHSNSRFGYGSIFAMANADYYYHKYNKDYAIFIGVGVGVFSIANAQVYSSDYRETSKAYGRLGASVRAGFELWKSRVSLEYFFVRLSESDDNNSSEIDNGFLNFSIGFFFGGGKWQNRSGNSLE